MSNIRRIVGSEGSERKYFLVVSPDVEQKNQKVQSQTQSSHQSKVNLLPENVALKNIRTALLFRFKNDLTFDEKRERYKTLLEMVVYGVQTEFQIFQTNPEYYMLEFSKRKLKSYEIGLLEIWEAYKEDFPNEEFPF